MEKKQSVKEFIFNLNLKIKNNLYMQHTNEEQQPCIVNYTKPKKKNSLKEFIHLPYINTPGIIKWYRKTYLSTDIFNAFVISMVLIPQSIANSSIAGMEPQYGLYTSIIPLIIYSFLGSCRELAVGPVAVLSILISSSGLNKNEVFITTFISGMIQIFMGLLKLGSLINFFSHSMIKGVVFASSIIISSSHIFTVVGIEKILDKSLWKLLFNLVKNVKKFHIPTLITSLCNFILLFILNSLISKYNIKNLPSALFVLILNMMVFYFFELNENYDIQILGQIDFNFPYYSPLDFDLLWADLRDSKYKLLSESILFAFIGYTESVTIANSLSSVKNYKVDANQELFAVGVMNAVSSFLQCFVSSGSFSRSVISKYNKTESQFSGLFCGLLILFFSFFFKNLLFYLPKSAISCIIINSCLKLFDLKTPKYFWKINKIDFITWFAAFVFSISFGFQFGVVAGVSVSFFELINRITNPNWARLGQIKDPNRSSLTFYRNIKRYKEAVILEDIEIIRFDLYLNFANIEFFRNIIREIINTEKRPKNLILDFSMISSLDATSIHGLIDMRREFENVNIFFCCMRGPVRDIIKKSDLLKVFTHPNEIMCPECLTHFHNEIHDIVLYIQKSTV